jgi:hypothetical protein
MELGKVYVKLEKRIVYMTWVMIAPNGEARCD